MLEAKVTDLFVSAALHDDRGWYPAKTRRVDARGIRWPVDLPVHPSGPSDESKTFQVVIEAMAGSELLAQTRAVTSFRAGDFRVLPLSLSVCPGAPPVCSLAGCQGEQCAVCREGACKPAGFTFPEELAIAGSMPIDDAAVVGPRDASGPSDSGAAAAAPDDAAISDSQATESFHDGGPIATTLDAGSDAGAEPECSDTKACPSGSTCVASKCAPQCGQTVCDPNADCVTTDNIPSCACRSAYYAQGTGSSMRCVRDRDCAELDCPITAFCEVLLDRPRYCKCKLGYAGPDCTPVSCGTPPTVSNGGYFISGDGSPTYGNRVTFYCNAGFMLDGIDGSQCALNGKWTAISNCVPIN